jgi:hypothetical protein
MLAQHRYDLRFRPFTLLHCSKVQVGCGFLLSHAPDLGGAYNSTKTRQQVVELGRYILLIE